MSTSCVTSGAPWVIAASPPMSTQRTSWRPRSRMTASGWKSARTITGSLQVRLQVLGSYDRRANSLLRRALERRSDEGPVDPLPDRRRDLEGEPGRPKQLHHAVDAGHDRSALDPGDGGLRDSGLCGQ